MKNLSELFQESRGARIAFGDRTIWSLFEIDLPGGESRVEVTFRTRPVGHGIRLRVTRGSLVAGGLTTSVVDLWPETAPSTDSVAVSGVTQPAALKVWNVWRTEGDVTQAWIGNAGMLVEPTHPGGWEFSASSGSGSIDFLELLFAVRLIS